MPFDIIFPGHYFKFDKIVLHCRFVMINIFTKKKKKRIKIWIFFLLVPASDEYYNQLLFDIIPISNKKANIIAKDRQTRDQWYI